MTDQVANMKARFDHAAAKQTLKEKYEAKMLFALFDGLWKATPTLIVLLQASTDKHLYILDEYANPCKVNREQMLTKTTEVWQEQMNAWHHEYEEIRKIR